MIITREDLREWGACYSDEEIAELVPPGGIALEDVLHAESVPPAHRVWVATRHGVLDESLRRRWLVSIIRRQESTRSASVLEYLDRGGPSWRLLSATCSNAATAAATDAADDVYDSDTADDVYLAAASAEHRAQVADLLSLLEES
jgi:hypothetical protein